MLPKTSSVKKFDLSDLNSIVPRFGKFCGPGWSAGQADANISIDEMKKAPVAKIYGPLGEKGVSQLDQLCKDHDIAYKEAEGKTNANILISQADTTLFKGLVTQFPTLYPEEKPYALMAMVAFASKISYYDGPKNILGLFKIPVSISAAEGQNSELQSFQIKDGEILYSVQLNKDGTAVVARNDGANVLSIQIDPNKNEIELREKAIDSFGNVVDETRIHTDFDTAISLLSHSTDNVPDVDGVVIGKLTQDKLDQFAKLGSAALHHESVSSPDHGTASTTEASAKQLLSSLDIPLSSDALDTLDGWFADVDPIIVEPYRWEYVDQNLRKFWTSGTEEILPAYDLSRLLDDGSGYSEAGNWASDNTQPLFSDIGNGRADTFTTPIFTWNQQPSNFWSSSGSSNPGFSGSGSLTSGSPFNSYIDPLVLKLGGGSVHTTNLAGSKVMFDMNCDGRKERTGWITADEGFLVMDKNGNGRIDDASEMFSEFMSPTAKTGFGALAELDANHNGSINAKDPLFKQLRLWIDINCNGETDKGELHTLEEFGIVYFSVGTTALNYYDNGNLVTRFGDYIAASPSSSRFGEIAEVLFNFGDAAPVDTVYITDQLTAVRTKEGKAIEVLSDKIAQPVNASLSGVNVLVGGPGDVLNAGSAGQSILIGNGKTTLNGNAGNVHFIVNGAGNSVNTGSGMSFIEVNGDANKINASKGDVAIEVGGNRNQISIGSGAEVRLGGSGNTLTAAAKSNGNEIVVAGSNSVINASNASIDIDPHASVTLNGKANNITMAGDATLAGKASGGTLTVAGDGNKATLSGAFIAVTDGAGLTLTGTNHQIVMAGDADLTMKSTGAGSTIFVFGEDNQLNSSKANVILAEGAGLNLNGSGDKLSLLGDATVNAVGTGHVIDVYGSGNEVSATRSKVYEHAFAEVNLSGAGNTLKVTPDNSKIAQKELAAQNALEQQVGKALEKYVGLTGEVPGADVPAGIVGVAAIDGGSETGGSIGMPVVPQVH